MYKNVFTIKSSTRKKGGKRDKRKNGKKKKSNDRNKSLVSVLKLLGSKEKKELVIATDDQVNLKIKIIWELRGYFLLLKLMNNAFAGVKCVIEQTVLYVI